MQVSAATRLRRAPEKKKRLFEFACGSQPLNRCLATMSAIGGDSSAVNSANALYANFSKTSNAPLQSESREVI